MAKNKHPGTCYCCGLYVPAGYGHFQRDPINKIWLIKCVICVSRNHKEMIALKKIRKEV